MKKNKLKKIIIILIFIAIIVALIIYGSRLLNKGGENANQNSISEGQESQEGNIIQREQLGEYNAKMENGVHVNTSGEMQNVKQYKGLELNNVNLETLGNRTVMLADAKNTTDKTIGAMTVKVDLLSKDGKTVVTLEGTLDEVEAGKIVQLNVDIEGDYTDVYDYRIHE